MKFYTVQDYRTRQSIQNGTKTPIISWLLEDYLITRTYVIREHATDHRETSNTVNTPSIHHQERAKHREKGTQTNTVHQLQTLFIVTRFTAGAYKDRLTYVQFTRKTGKYQLQCMRCATSTWTAYAECEVEERASHPVKRTSIAT